MPRASGPAQQFKHAQAQFRLKKHHQLIYSYFKEVITIKFIILYKTIVLYDIYLKLTYISILLNL